MTQTFDDPSGAPIGLLGLTLPKERPSINVILRHLCTPTDQHTPTPLGDDKANYPALTPLHSTLPFYTPSPLTTPPFLAPSSAESFTLRLFKMTIDELSRDFP